MKVCSLYPHRFLPKLSVRHPQVYIPAIEGHVPQEMVRALGAFTEFCYLARRNVLTETSLAEMDDALQCFHRYRTIFQTTGVRPDGFSLPRQHSLVHYPLSIRLYGAPNGLCSSITESKHIKAVKEPWRRSNRYEALGQMLLTNQRLDKLAASRVDFKSRGMLSGTCLSEAITTLNPPQTNDADGGNDECGDVSGPRTVAHTIMSRAVQHRRLVGDVAAEIGHPNLLRLLRQFLHDRLHPDGPHSSAISLAACPMVDGRLSIHNSAAAIYYAPSDLSGIGGMHREHIRAVCSWRGGPARYDCAFVKVGTDDTGVETMSNGCLEVVRVLLFFSFHFMGKTYCCALVRWFTRVGEVPDKDTGMWMVRPGSDENETPLVSVVHLDNIIRAAHLIGISGNRFIPEDLHYSQSLDFFLAFYVNKFADHHAFEIAS